MVIKVEAAQRLKAATLELTKFAAFNGNILQIGFGGVGQTILPMMLRHFDMDHSGITVIEKDDHHELFDAKYGNTHVNYKVLEVTQDNIDEVLSTYLSAGDLC